MIPSDFKRFVVPKKSSSRQVRVSLINNNRLAFSKAAIEVINNFTDAKDVFLYYTDDGQIGMLFVSLDHPHQDTRKIISCRGYSFIHVKGLRETLGITNREVVHYDMSIRKVDNFIILTRRDK